MPRIVLIEDDGPYRAFLGEALRGGGHELTEADEGFSGLEAIRRELPDLVICDVELPKLDGYGVLAALRSDPGFESLPFVFLTGLDRTEQVRAGMRFGADDYLTKPVSVRDLLDSVNARVARREATRRASEGRLDELRRSLTTLLPHEMRTPLTGLLGSLSLLCACHRELTPEQVDDLAAGALRSAHRLHRAAENYLLHAQLELQGLTGGGPLARPFAGSSTGADVEAAVGSVVADAGRSDDVRLELAPVAVPIGAPYLRKTVGELVDNALKFSSRGAPVGVRLLRRPGEVALEVTDAGPGLTRAQIEEIGAFRQFGCERLEQQGSGLGLALVRAIAEASGGRLEFTREPENCVRVVWPSEARRSAGT